MKYKKMFLLAAVNIYIVSFLIDIIRNKKKSKFEDSSQKKHIKDIPVPRVQYIRSQSPVSQKAFERHIRAEQSPVTKLS